MSPQCSSSTAWWAKITDVTNIYVRKNDETRKRHIRKGRHLRNPSVDPRAEKSRKVAGHAGLSPGGDPISDVWEEALRSWAGDPG